MRCRGRYRDGTLILETDFETETGTARVIDFMPLRAGGAPQVVRIVEGLAGEVPMCMRFSARLDYGSLVPWVERTADGILALGGPNCYRQFAAFGDRLALAPMKERALRSVLARLYPDDTALGGRALANRRHARESVMAIFRHGDTVGNAPGSKWCASSASRSHGP